MRATLALAQNLRLTLFTRANCGLCDTAKRNVHQVQARKPFKYTEVDIMEPEHKAWRDVYEFDVPVLHLQKILSPSERYPEILAEATTKLFHRFSEEEVEDAMDKADEA